MAYIYYNPNPMQKNTGDCVIRALCKITNKDWYYIYIQLSILGFMHCDWGNKNEIWGMFLKKIGYERHVIENTCPDCYSVSDFCKEHNSGKYILSTGSHTIAVINGDIYDAWNSLNELPIMYWCKNEKMGE